MASHEDWKERIAFKDFLIWKPPGGVKVKLKDQVFNPMKAKGKQNKIVEKKLLLKSNKYRDVGSTLAYIRKEAQTYTP